MSFRLSKTSRKTYTTMHKGTNTPQIQQSPGTSGAMTTDRGNPSAKVTTYAVLDNLSTDVFVKHSLLEQLGVEDQEVYLEIDTVTGVSSVHTQKVKGLRIQDMDNLHKSIKVSFGYS